MTEKVRHKLIVRDEVRHKFAVTENCDGPVTIEFVANEIVTDSFPSQFPSQFQEFSYHNFCHKLQLFP